MFAANEVALDEPAAPDGLVSNRRQLRRLGPFVALVIPALVLAGAASTWRHGGLWAAVFALPAAVVAGIPIEQGTARYVAAVGASLAIWLLLGVIAARNASREPIAGWRDYWRELAWLVLALWAGVAVGLAAVAYFVGYSGLV